MEFIRSLETRLACLDPEVVRLVADAATKVLADYEITDRCTDLAQLDDPNAKTIKRYCACLLVDGKSQKTIKQYRRAITLLSEFMGKSFQEFGAYDIRYYLACEKDRGISNTSLENTRRYLSAFFQWMLTEEMIPKNPMAAIKPIKCTDEVKLPFSDTEIDAIRSACQTSKDRAVVEMLLSSGVRVTELSMMNVADVDLTTMTVHVMHGKGDVSRMVPYHPTLGRWLEGYAEARRRPGDSYFFESPYGGMMTQPCVWTRFTKVILPRAGIVARPPMKVTVHSLRHTFACHSLDAAARSGADMNNYLPLLSAYMGHRDIKSTELYLRLTRERFDGIISACHHIYDGVLGDCDA
jgi:site-specific recombinase XerD